MTLKYLCFSGPMRIRWFILPFFSHISWTISHSFLEKSWSWGSPVEDWKFLFAFLHHCTWSIIHQLKKILNFDYFLWNIILPSINMLQFTFWTPRLIFSMISEFKNFPWRHNLTSCWSNSLVTVFTRIYFRKGFIRSLSWGAGIQNNQCLKWIKCLVLHRKW